MSNPAGRIYPQGYPAGWGKCSPPASFSQEVRGNPRPGLGLACPRAGMRTGAHRVRPGHGDRLTPAAAPFCRGLRGVCHAPRRGCRGRAGAGRRFGVRPGPSGPARRPKPSPPVPLSPWERGNPRPGRGLARSGAEMRTDAHRVRPGHGDTLPPAAAPFCGGFRGVCHTPRRGCRGQSPLRKGRPAFRDTPWAKRPIPPAESEAGLSDLTLALPHTGGGGLAGMPPTERPGPPAEIYRSLFDRTGTCKYTENTWCP